MIENSITLCYYLISLYTHTIFWSVSTLKDYIWNNKRGANDGDRQVTKRHNDKTFIEKGN